MDNELQATIRTRVADENVKHVQLWFTDILGNLKMVEVPDRQLDNVIESGAPFDGSSITGYAEIEESDIVAMPDWTTFKVLPWSQNHERTAFVFCDILDRDYQPYEGDPRWVLRRQLKRAADMGLDFYVGPELEYFYFKARRRPRAHRRGRLLRRPARRPRQRPAQADDAHARQARHPHGGLAPRGRAVAARDRPALRRGPGHGRPGHDLAPHRQGGRGPQRRATRPSCPSRSTASTAAACTSTSRCSAATRTPSSTATTPTTSPTSPRGSSPGSCATCARSARSSTSG